MIVRMAFEAAGTFDIDLVPQNMVGSFLSRSLSLADITGTARSNIAKSSQRIGHEVDLSLPAFWKSCVA